MNDYFHKYIKYKTKYLEIKYGGKRKKKPVASGAAASGAAASAVSAATPAKLHHSTPKNKVSSINTPGSNLSTSSTDAVSASPPKLKIAPKSLEILIENKDDLVCLLSACPFLSKYDITSRPTATRHLYINFKKKGDVSDFAHFSFHYPQEEEESKIYDMFVANTFHLKLDIFPDIVFNLILDGGRLVLQSKMKPKNIIKKITNSIYDELVNIKNCLEKILNMPDYKNTIIEPVSRQLFL